MTYKSNRRCIGVDHETARELEHIRTVLEADGTRRSMADLIRLLVQKHGEELTGARAA